ncbi:MAG: hypothetical protein ACKVRN_06235, partial [Pyrinomonadaceae bacterium]
MKKIILCAVAVLCVAASIFGGYYYFANDSVHKTEAPQIQQKESEKEGATVTEWGRRWLTDAWRDENGHVSVYGLANAVAQRDAYLAAHNPPDGFGDKGVANMNWLSRGPQNVGGRTRSLVINKNDPTGNTMWAGAVSGGVWRSTNGGSTWTAMNGGLQNFAVNCLVAEYVPFARYPVLWAGTGDGRSGDGLAGGGLFKSLNGGMSWIRMEETVDQEWRYIDSIAIIKHYFNPNTQQYEDVMLAGVDSPNSLFRGIMRSINGGESWSQVYAARTALSIVAHPNSPGDVIAEVRSPGIAGNSNLHRVIYSSDGGQRWETATRTSNPNPNPNTDPPFETNAQEHIVKLSYFDGDPSIVYANDGDPFGSNGQISKSTDGGRSFTTNNLGGIPYFWGYMSLFWVSPTDPDLLVTGGNFLWRSDDGGATGSFEFIAGHFYLEDHPHADSQYAIHDPNYGIGTNRKFYATNDGGIYRAEDITTATHTNGGWRKLNQTYQTTQFYSAAGDGNSGIISGGTQDNCVLRLINGTQDAFQWLGSCDGGSAAVDQNICYGQANGLLERAMNCNEAIVFGETIYDGITDYDYNAVWFAPMIVDPTAPNRFSFGASSVWRSNNINTTNGQDITWSEIKVNPPIPSPTGGLYKPVRITAMDVLPSNSNIMWVAEMDVLWPYLEQGRLYKTVNANAIGPSPEPTPQWIQVDNNIPPLPNRKILKILIDPGDSTGQTVYVGFAGGISQGNNNAEDNLYGTINGGDTWTDLTGDANNCSASPSAIGLPCVPVNAIAIDPNNRSKIYVGTDIGIYVTEDVTADPVEWLPLTKGPANVKISDLNYLKGVNPDGSRTLLAATYGRGLWTVKLGTQIQAEAAINDFDGDGRSDLAVVRQEDAHKDWHVQGSAEGYRTQEFGNRDDKVAAADYDGDGKTDMAIYRDSEQKFYCLRSSDNTLAVTVIGQPNGIELPASGDFDGDDLADEAVFNQYTGLWSVEQSSEGHL